MSSFFVNYFSVIFQYFRFSLSVFRMKYSDSSFVGRAVHSRPMYNYFFYSLALLRVAVKVEVASLVVSPWSGWQKVRLNWLHGATPPNKIIPEDSSDHGWTSSEVQVKNSLTEDFVRLLNSLKISFLVIQKLFWSHKQTFRDLKRISNLFFWNETSDRHNISNYDFRPNCIIHRL